MDNQPNQTNPPHQQAPLTNAQQQQIFNTPLNQKPTSMFPASMSNSNQQMLFNSQAPQQQGLFIPMSNSNQQMHSNLQVPQQQGLFASNPLSNSQQQMMANTQRRQQNVNIDPMFQQLPGYINMPPGVGHHQQPEQGTGSLYNDDEPLIERVK